MAPAAAELALVGCFQQVYGRHKNRQFVVEKLAAHFTGRGEALPDLQLAVDLDDVESWEVEWDAHMVDANCESKADRIKLIQWLKARSGNAGGRDIDKVKSWANDVINDLESVGVVLDARQTAELRAKIDTREKGELKSQCIGKMPVGILYWGRALSDQDGEEYEAQFNALGGADGGTVDVTRFESYIKLHKNTEGRSVMTLERALKKESDWQDYLLRTVEALERAALPKCALQLMRLDMAVTKHCGGSWARKQAYLVYYFFTEHLGIGVPTLMAVSSFAAAFGAAGAVQVYSSTPPLKSPGSRSALPIEDIASASEAGQSHTSSALTQLAAQMEGMQKMLPKPGSEAQPAGLASVTRKTSCDFCRRSVCAIFTGVGRPCRQYHRAVELLRKEIKAKQEAEAAAESES